jgi:hypothetical protein
VAGCVAVRPGLRRGSRDTRMVRPAGIKMGTGISADTRSPHWRQTHDQGYSCQPVLRDFAR